MTHDELLAKVIQRDKPMADEDSSITWLINKLWKHADAVLAVVELHTPINAYFNGKTYLACNHCEQWTTADAYQLDYPCPTIQAIEKELK